MKNLYKKLTNLIALISLLTLFSQTGWGQIWTEDFTSGTYSVTLGGEGNDGTADYFQTTDGSNIGISYTGNTGNFFAAQDIDDGGWTGSASPSQLTWTGINISGYTGLSFSGLFASNATDKIDDNDYVKVEINIDGTGWTTILEFENEGTQYNTYFLEDTDFDGTGDGTQLTSTFTNFSKNISGTGNLLDLRITVAVNSGGEDFAFDTFQLLGTSSNDNDSQVSASSTLSEPATISSLVNSSTGVQVFDFTFTDLGTSDGLATIIDQLQITQGSANGVADWTNAIAGAVLNGPDVTNMVGTVNATDITFSGSGFISISDNSNETYTLSIWLNTDLSAISDNDILEFAMNYSDITEDASGSLFGSGAPESGDTNIAIDIDATELRFAQQPTTANINDCMSPDVAVEATDINGNRDLDFTESIRITSTGSLTGTPVDVTAVSGLATFSGANCIEHSATGTNLTLNAERTNTLDWDVTSDPFDITDINACGLEEFNGGTTAPPGWTFTNIGGTYTTETNYGTSSPSLQMDATGDIIETATVTSPSQLTFWIKGQGTDASSALLVEGWDGSWNTIENITNLPTTGTTKTYNTGLSSYTKFRFSYTKSAGNLAFDDVDVTCGSCVEPTNDATALNFPSKNSTSIDLSWTNGNGGNRIVICREGAAVSFTPADNNTYTANSDYSAGTEVGTAGEGNKVIYNGNASTTTVTGLIPGTTYYFKIYEYGCSGGAEDYLTSGTPAEGNETTLPENVNNFTLSCITNTTATLTWDLPSGNFDGILITAREGTTPPVDPTCDGSSLSSPDTDFSTALQYCGTTTPSKYVYNATGTTVTVTNLNPGADYIFKAFTYKGTDWTSGTQKSGNAAVNPVTDENSFVSNGQIRLTWTNPVTCYDEIMIVGKQGGSPTASPTGNGSLYTADAVFGTAPSGNNLPVGEYCVYKGVNTFIDVTNLTNGLNYCFKIFVRKGEDWSIDKEVCATPADITVFKPGDLLFVGYDTKTSDNGCGGAVATDVFYIMTMVDIKPGTSFGLFNASYEYGAAANERTDKFWSCTATPGQYSPGRIDMQWNGTSNISAGSVIEVFLTPTGAASYFEVNGTDETANFSSFGSYCNMAETSPDQMWIYQGTITDYGSSPNIYSTINGNILFGLSNQAAWVPFSNAVSTARTSRIHPDIECFNMDFSGDVPVNYYQTSATHNGSKRTILGNIMNSGNWSVVSNTDCNDVPAAVGTTTFTISGGYSAGTWRGDADDDWFNCSNWEELTVPDKDFDVEINGTTTISNSPKISNTSSYASKYDNIAECNNLTIDNETLTIKGSLYDTLFVNGNLTIQNSGILDMNSGTANDGLVYLSGNWDNQATFDAGKGTIVFNGENSQTLTTSAANETFNNLRINNSNLLGLTTNNNLIINDTLSQENSLLNLNGNNIELKGVYENTNSYFEGDINSDFTISSDTDNGNIDSIYFKNDFNLNNFSVDRTGRQAVLMTNLSIQNNLTVTNGSVVLTAGHNYDVNGTLINTPGTPDALILKSDASGTASLIQNAGAIPATVERYLSGNNWHYIFAPLTQIDTAVFTVAPWGDINPNFYFYDESIADYWNGLTVYNPTGWTANNAGNQYLQTDRGYIHRFTADKIYTQTGGNLEVNDKTFNISLTDNSSESYPNYQAPPTWPGWDKFDGWNLAGNPYVSAVDWDAIPSSDKSDIENYIYYYDDTQDKYLCYGGNPPWNNNGVSINGGTQYIPAGQSFMIKATANGTFTIPANTRVHSSQSFYKKNSNSDFNNLLRIQIKQDNYTDETVIRTFPEETGVTQGHDFNYDAYKMFAWDVSKPQIYSLSDDKKDIFTVNTLPDITEKKVIPLGVSVNNSGNYFIEITENYFNNTHVILEDRLYDIFTDMNKYNSYEFSQSAENNEDRFFLHLEKNIKPVLNGKIPDQIAYVSNLYEFYLPENLFSDENLNDTLIISVTSENGEALPQWLNFDSERKLFYGIPDKVQTLNIIVSATDKFGLSVSDNFNLKVEKSSGIKPYDENDITVYPNPANSFIYIVLPDNEKYLLKLFSVTGNKIFEKNIYKNPTKVEINRLISGVYFLEITQKNKTVRKKIIKK